MDNFLDNIKTPEDLHHVYFFVGSISDIKQELLKFFDKKLKINIVGNPDFKVLDFQNLSIDEARAIREDSEKKNFAGKMIFIISFETISIEAQNSLLKVLEEPTLDTHFFLISPQDTLLPTLKSRIQTLKFQISNFKFQNESTILQLNLKERLEKVKEIIESISEEENTKQSAIEFVNTIETELYSGGVEKNVDKLELCQSARKYLFDRGAPVKMILENLVLSI